MPDRLDSLVGSSRGGGRVEAGGFRVEDGWAAGTLTWRGETVNGCLYSWETTALDRVLYVYKAGVRKGRGLCLEILGKF